MKKYFNVAVLMFLAVGLMSGSAFAAASLNAGNATVAAEKIAATATALPTTAANTAYQPGGAVGVSTQIKVSLTGGVFGNVLPSGITGFNICSATNKMGGVAGNGVQTTLGATSVVIPLTQPLASGTVYTIQADNCNALSAAIGANILVNAGSLAGSTVGMTVDNNTSPGDGNLFATTTIATLTNQFSVILVSPAADIIDFAATPTMTSFKAGGSGSTTTSVAKIAILSDETLGTKINTNLASNIVCGAFPATGEAFSFTVTPGSGTTMGSGFNVGAAYKGNAHTLVGTILATAANATATATLNNNLAAKVCGAGSSVATYTAGAVTQTLTITGTTPLTVRSYKLAVGTTVSGGIDAAARPLLAATTAWNWALDATQFYIPLIKTGPGFETYIKLQSKSTLSGSNGVVLQILASDGTMVAITPAAPSIMTGTPYTLTGAELAAAAEAAGHPVSGTNGFAAILTVNSPNADVFGFANIVNSAGEKRVPMQRVNAASSSTITAGDGTVTIPGTIAE